MLLNPILLISSLLTAAGAATQGRAADGPVVLSAPTRAYLERPMDKAAFDAGITLLKRRTEPVQARRMILDKIHGARRGMDVVQLRSLLSEATAIAKDPREHPAMAAQAIGAIAGVNRLLLEKGEITTESMKREASFLMALARDPLSDRELRGRAIRTLADLNVTEAAALMQGLLADPTNDKLPEVVRNGCLALARLSPETALSAISSVMRRTSDPAVFGSAACALGRIRTPEAMTALVKLQDRFPDSDSCGAALSEMWETILATLRRPDDPNLVTAIRAARQLGWKQSQRVQAVPLLLELLKTAPPPARTEALEALSAMAAALNFADENRELGTLLGLIADQPGMQEHAARIRKRLAAKPLTISGPSLPVPPE